MQATTTPARDLEGSAYGRRPGMVDEELARTGPGTPCGELMRRYWQPIAVAATVTTTPQRVRVLNEDLVLFRDGRGRAGLLVERCAHRGTSLYYGRVDDEGISCCYHGWKFDTEGRCVLQPCEPEGGRHRNKIRQPWYPVQECYGLVFAYMGPPERMPVLPRWDILEELQPGQKVFASGPSGFGAGADDSIKVVPFNWLQQYENTADPFHLTILHTRHSGVQFGSELSRMPTVRFEPVELGMQYVARFIKDNGRSIDRVSPALLPNVRCPGSTFLEPGPSNTITWSVPVDDTSHFIFQASRVPESFQGVADSWRATRPVRISDEGLDRTPTIPKLWSEMTEEQRQRYPSDWEAQASQGTITLHSEEHLATSDIGIVMLRRLLREQIRRVQEGGDPIGVEFDPAKALFKAGGGNYYAD